MKKFGLFLLLLVLAFFVVGGFLPSVITVERSITVNRPAATLFTVLNGFRLFNDWSPWVDLDPNATFTRSGPDQGVGARLAWSGDPSLIGVGWQEIVRSDPWSRIDIRMDIGGQGMATSQYLITGDPLGSAVTWRFETDVTEGQGWFGGLLGRYFGLFLERWIGDDYERGLQLLKVYVEALPPDDFTGADIALVQVAPMTVATVGGDASRDSAAVALGLAEGFSAITNWAVVSGVQLGGQPLAITRNWDADQVHFEAAIPIEGDLPEALDFSGPVQLGAAPSGPAVRVVHRGDYASTLRSYQQLFAWMAAHGYREEGTSWEHYISDPTSTPESELETHIYFLVDES